MSFIKLSIPMTARPSADFRDDKRQTYLNLGVCKIENKRWSELDIRYPISYNKDEITDLLNRKLPCKAIWDCHDFAIDEKHPLFNFAFLRQGNGHKVPSKPIVIGDELCLWARSTFVPEYGIHHARKG